MIRKNQSGKLKFLVYFTQLLLMEKWKLIETVFYTE